ncbi:hypothetical protein JM18_001701 [Phytophthora kernoviae]|uniref:Uncharacterized protein n=2 Tax=Phytophthora kernoviae TaxID=325452 RepID=A0A8T0M743_9STRA|nr:hypothetical protein G195_002148 [Phytophthora kernoviae 00238/432]KAG2530575.1 hypothetical protein JM16_000923 [Phytophthora kernoviae]KAG2531294.1 hypothetical protein JM18_001701 [Phytophthora kernoviae]
MNLWALNDESVASQPRRKKTTFADDVGVASSSGGWGGDASSQRRKQQRGKVEVVVEDHDSDDDNDDPRKASNVGTPRLSGIIESTNRKTNEIISADIVEAVSTGSDVTGSSQPSLSSEERRQQNGKKQGGTAKQTLDNGVHHLVREFLLLHNHGDIVKILDKERERSVSAERKTRVKAESTAGSHRKKPVLNVITSNLGQDVSNIGTDAVVKDATESGYNRLNHPGSTPKPQAHEIVFGDPGSTPLARAKDLRALGFEDIDDDGDDDEEEADSTNVSSKATSDNPKNTGSDVGHDTGHFSEYAIRKRALRTAPKHVQLGNAGSTPTKEYIFFRETPPSFVTETIEDAVEVFEKLGNDPEFIQQAVVVERFIELNSSEVSKYSVGQQVNELGAQGDICGVVSKVYGSRLCGTAGPGTIVIDTRPEESPVGL